MAQSKRKLYVIGIIFFFICDSSYIYAYINFIDLSSDITFFIFEIYLHTLLDDGYGLSPFEYLSSHLEPIILYPLHFL